MNAVKTRLFCETFYETKCKNCEQFWEEKAFKRTRCNSGVNPPWVLFDENDPSLFLRWLPIILQTCNYTKKEVK